MPENASARAPRGPGPGQAALTDAKRRLLEALKRADGATTSDLAEQFGLTETAVRQHLASLEDIGLVARRTPEASALGSGRGPGRPGLRWTLTGAAAGQFPDRHANLAVDLLDAVRAAGGEDALARVIEVRAAQLRDTYRRAMNDGNGSSLLQRVRRLADVRSQEGYMAEAHRDGDGVLLVEHHCPIAAAAASCSDLCRTELELFGTVLGDGVAVSRERHALDGDGRCVYRVTPVTD